jgi:hypothetical protein
MSINVNTPGSRVEEVSGCGMQEGTHTCLHKLGYCFDGEGNRIDIKRIEDALLETCQKILGRVPSYHMSEDARA